jgi:hypothetical protein
MAYPSAAVTRASLISDRNIQKVYFAVTDRETGAVDHQDADRA